MERQSMDQNCQETIGMPMTAFEEMQAYKLIKLKKIQEKQQSMASKMKQRREMKIEFLEFQL